MNTDPRFARLAAWATALALVAGAFLISLRLGVGPLVLAVALLVIGAFGVRVAALSGLGWARNFGAVLEAGVLGRYFGPATTRDPEAPARVDDHATASLPEARPNGFNTEWTARLRQRLLAATQAGGGALTLKQWAWVGAVLLTILTPLLLRIYRLDDLQAEMYGDITIVHEYVQSILAGQWPTTFILSSGPLYHYMIAPVIAFTGVGYFGIKLAAVLTSLLTLATVFLLSKRLIGTSFALLATFVAGISSWLLVFSRLGNSQIIVPLLVMAALWFMLRFLQNGDMRDLGLSAFFAALGFYGYPQSFVIAPALFVTLIVLRFAGHSISLKAFGLYVLVAAAVALPLLPRLTSNLSLGPNEYLGNKIFGAEQPLSGIASNLLRAMLGFHVLGDEVFRSNPAKLPHLDLISGLFMLAGIVFWLRRERWRWGPLLLVPLVLLQLPSALVVNFPNEVPSASRALGSAPVAYVLVASGLWWLFELLRRRVSAQWLAPAALAAVLVAMLGLNMQRYFVDYIGGLPYDNTPIARLVRQHIDSLPKDTKVYLYHCCWERGMPEPKSIRYDMPETRTFVEVPLGSLNCNTLDALLAPPAVLIWDYRSVLADPALAACADRLPGQLYSSIEGKPAFYAATLRSGAGILSAGSLGTVPVPLDSPLPLPSSANDPVPGLNALPSDAMPGSIIVDELASSDVTVSGREAVLNHSLLDIGSASAAVDGDPATLMRGRQANPFVLELAFVQPQKIRSASLRLQELGPVNALVTLIFPDGRQTTIAFSFASVEPDKPLEFDLTDGEIEISDLRFELIDQRLQPTDGYHMHVYELTLD